MPFTAQTRMSGVDLRRRRRHGGPQGRRQRGPTKWVRDNGGTRTAEVGEIVDGISAAGGTPLVVAETRGRHRPGPGCHPAQGRRQGRASRERFDELRRMGIRTVMITGDNPLTAKAIADEAGVDDFLAEATPEDKMALIKKEQAGGKLVAMTGDGTNDAPALAQADVGVAMNTGTTAAKEAGNMVDLDSNPTKLIEIVEIGKQLLITRGRADHLLHRQRRRQVLRDHARHVRRRSTRAGQAQHHAPEQPGVRDHLGDHLQRADHHRADPAGAARRPLPAVAQRPRCCAATCGSTASAGWSSRSSASS